ncbi:hypothetical protein HanXRQr2_Chr02g0077191 [Helianthus annuus]|nr:hypothetical protein HanXRQr2_Chr02g0077191 [Helianthus annuus]KAJ0605555.1 hypothetical protein HanHA300_Chr02g0064331 [Helianthus annuus]KAJ0619571.1 hypothetical protein HanHA89_Chr02g0072791 [Helianthus annuus]KAJ0787034.1 hypothetical protein HanOQP8_Chr02g0077991 [Helianthus annuus]
MDNTGLDRRHEVEGNVMHIMKALPSHHAPAQSLIEDNSLQLLFEMVANGSLILSSRYKEGFSGQWLLWIQTGYMNSRITITKLDVTIRYIHIFKHRFSVKWFFELHSNLQNL